MIKRNLLTLFALICMAWQSCQVTTEKKDYESLYDPIKDVGQYRLPALNKTPRYCQDLIINASDHQAALKEHLLAASISGLTARAINKGQTDTGIWIVNSRDHGVAYQTERESLEKRGCRFLAPVSPLALATGQIKLPEGAEINIRRLFDGYILIDMDQNPESGTVAVTASHVYNGLIVDKEFQAEFEKAGYKLLYDASRKHVRDAWNEFKEKCNPDGLVVMPNNTWELRDVAIQNSWFFMNLYARPHDAATGDYWGLYEDAAKTLENHSLIYGWEAGPHSEQEINDVASVNAQASAVNDWFYNYCLVNSDYENRQEPVLANVLNPKTIDYNKKKRLVSFFMSDGDNNQWMMGGFIENWYDVPQSSANKVAFGIPASTLPQMAPAAYKYLLEHQPENSTLVEVQGGGVFYSDTYGKNRNREKCLKEKAEMTAAWMRQHRIRVLGLMAKESVGSGEAKEAYQAFIEANDQLEGIIALQYTPYAGGKGDIYWFANKEGYQIPVITIKYSLWNEPYRREREGTPKYIANRLDKDQNNPDFNLVCIHAWSHFSDQGKDCDELAETKNGNIMGSGIATLLKNHLDDSYEVVSLQELIWQVRMKFYPEQTKKYLKTIL
ncbi:MAG: hypothetical protein AB2L20_02480 [Mangrovibacterium sp.]